MSDKGTSNNQAHHSSHKVKCTQKIEAFQLIKPVGTCTPTYFSCLSPLPCIPLRGIKQLRSEYKCTLPPFLSFTLSDMCQWERCLHSRLEKGNALRRVLHKTKATRLKLEGRICNWIISNLCRKVWSQLGSDGELYYAWFIEQFHVPEYSFILKTDSLRQNQIRLFSPLACSAIYALRLFWCELPVFWRFELWKIKAVAL